MLSLLRYILLLFSLFFCLQEGYASTITSIEIAVIDNGEVKVSGKITVNLICQLENGKRKVINPKKKFGKVGWDKFQVHISGGTFEEGVITLDPVMAHQLNDSLYLSVVLKEKPSISTREAIYIPYPVSLTILQESPAEIPHTYFVNPDLEISFSDGQVIRWDLLSFSTSHWQPAIKTNGLLDPETGLGTPEQLSYLPEIVLSIDLPAFQISVEGKWKTDYSDLRVMDFNARHGASRLLAWDGEDGADAKPIQIYMQTKIHENVPYLYILVVSGERRETAILDTRGEGILIEAYGGNGGDGGDGSDGSDGSNETDHTAATAGEEGENGGDGGDGGRGAEVIIYSDKLSKSYLSLIQVKNEGGYGGQAGLGGAGGEGGSLKDASTMPFGEDGEHGSAGFEGPDGPEPTYIQFTDWELTATINSLMDKAPTPSSNEDSQRNINANSSFQDNTQKKAGNKKKGLGYFGMSFLLFVVLAAAL